MITRTSRQIMFWGLGLVAGTVAACQVPVFRYALERWKSDRYEILVLGEEPLNEQQQQLVERLSKAIDSEPESPSAVRFINVTEGLDPGLRDLWRERTTPEQPLMIALYPKRSQVPNRLAYSASLTDDHVNQLLDSPVRQSIFSKLLQGDSAVWVFVPCGDSAKDEAAYQILESQLAKEAQLIELPGVEELEISEEVLDSCKIDLRIGFSIVRLERNDVQEDFLLQTLLNSESDLREFDEPLVFPVFGRGRVLYALVGKGISADTIRSATSFMTGPCSCQVKEQNPGFDMLLSGDWEQAIGEVLISDPIPAGDARPKLLTIPPGRTGR